jgi:hypothetical protein
LGHHFGLPHTHGRTFQTVAEAEDFLLSSGSLRSLDGDRPPIDDTPADPDIVEIRDNIPVEAITLGGQAIPLARRNIMSYWNHGGRAHLSHGQIDRVRELVKERRSRYLDVTVISPVDCPTLLAQIAVRQTRLAELNSERDAETDPLLRRRHAGAIARLRNEITTLSNRARTAGCT